MLPKIHNVQAEPLWKLPSSIRDRLRVDPRQLQFRHFLFCGIYCAVAVFFLIFYGTAAVMRGELIYAWVVYGFAVTTTVGYIAIWLRGTYILANHFITFLMGCLCVYLYYTGGTENSGPLYFLVFPMVALFQQGIKYGLVSVISLLVVTWLLQATGLFGFDTERYSFVFITRLATVYLIVSILAFMFAYFRHEAERELLLTEGDLEQIVYGDILTGLANQNLMSKLLYTEAIRNERYKTPYCLILLEIDQYQRILLRHGADYTNALMVELSKVFAIVLRRQDFAGRWDSNRFMILAPTTALTGGLVLANRLVEAVFNHPFTVGRQTFALSISIGLVEGGTSDATEQVNRADELLYHARKTGGNRVVHELPAGEEQETPPSL